MEIFYCSNCFSSCTTKNKLKEHEEICNNHDSCLMEIPRWAEKILEYNPGEKSLKALRMFIKKLQRHNNNNNNNNNN